MNAPWSDPFSLFGPFTVAFTVVSGIVVVGIVTVVGLMLWRFVRYATAEPQSAHAVCIGKRMDVRHRSTESGGSSTWYHATFETDDGRRFELDLDGRHYGLLAEGDRGIVTWKDTVFTGMQRDDLPRGGGIQDRIRPRP